MTICFLSYYQPDEFKGGVDRVCFMLSREFSARGYDLFYLYNKEKSADELETNYSTKKHIQFPNSIFWKNEAVDFFREVALQNSFDVVVDLSNSERCHEIAFLAQSQCYFKLISTCHEHPFIGLKSFRDDFDELIFNYSGKNSLKQIIYFILKFPFGFFFRKNYLSNRFNKASRESDAYVFLCERYAQMVRGIVDREQRRKIVSILNPIESIEQDSSIKEKMVLFVGRMDFQKRVDRLLRIWSHVENEVNDWHLVIVGEGKYRLQYQEYALQLKLKNVNFIGYARGIDYMRKSQIITMQSSHEGYPMVLIEAMMNSNVPIIFNSFEAAEDIIINGENGFLIETYKETRFADMLVKLMNDVNLRTRLQNEAFQSTKKYSVERVVDVWENLFLKLLVVTK